MDTTGRWPLFDRFPALEERLAPLALCTLPTPVQPLAVPPGRAWVKRDDLSCTPYGGNKMRKLEFVGAALLRRGARRVYTFGATGTNSGVATALFCHDHAIRCTLFTFPQPDTPVVQANQAALRALEVHQVPCGSVLGAALAWYTHPRRLDPRAAFVYAGCSDPVSVYAYVNAALELAGQVQRGECPEPAEIVVAAGSAATLAGLVLGCAVAGLGTRVVGVRVAPLRVGPVDACSEHVVRALMRGPARALGIATLPGFTLLHDWYGSGYGHATAAGTAAIAQAADLGLALESTYTGKAFAAFLQRLHDTPGNLLFWNTFNSQPLPGG